MIYVYILKSIKTGDYYIGQAQDLRQRLERHNDGRSFATKPKIPWELVYSEKFNNRSEAIKYEKFLKKQKSKKFLDRLIERGVAQLA